MVTGMANNNELPSVRRSCGDCVYCRGYISLWCKNPEAVKARGTAIPGIYITVRTGIAAVGMMMAGLKFQNSPTEC